MLRILWWPKRLKMWWKYTVRNGWQRSQRGWGNGDAWNAHYYVSDVIEGICRKLATEGCSHPSGMTHAEWTRILKKIAGGFAAAKIIIDDWPDEDEHKRLEAQWSEGFDLLKQYFWTWWD